MSDFAKEHGYPLSCDSCPVVCGCELIAGSDECAQRYAENQKPMNADRIRAMSDEELAAWICLPDCTAQRYEACFTITTEKRFDVPYDRQTDPIHDVLDWLRQPAEEDKNARDT